MSAAFRTGIEALVGADSGWLEGRRVGLVTHAAAVSTTGISSVDLLAEDRRSKLVALFAPEHGLFGVVPAGGPVRTRKHPALGIPIHSLYGAHRKPTHAALRTLDAIVFDLQDLSVRCYTYVSTLRLVMEAAAESGLPMMVADRPSPFPCTVDGPVTDQACTSFVSLIPTPMVYGMTTGEIALWLMQTLGLALDLRVAKMRGYVRAPRHTAGLPPWIPPSPGIVSWESAWCYPATVLAEAFGIIDHGRGTSLPFQVFSVARVKGAAICEQLSGMALPGVVFRRHHYIGGAGARLGKLCDGVRLTVTDPARFRPVAAAVAILSVIQRQLGDPARLWQHHATRPDFFDKLCGTRDIRLALLDGAAPETTARQWLTGNANFKRSREACLLYRSAPGAVPR